MKKPKRVRKKSKFGAPQVVATREHGFVFSIMSKRWHGNRWQYLSFGFGEYDEAELRPLTAKERGQ